MDEVNNQKWIYAALKDKGLLRNDATVIRSLVNPTSCGIDGSRAIERLMSTDIVAIAA